MIDPELSEKSDKQKRWEEERALVNRFFEIVRYQTTGFWDVHRCRAFWRTELPKVPPELLVPVLTELLTMGVTIAFSDGEEKALKTMREVFK
ncbi:hypothetical protein NRL09_12545 [Aeromonas caviae]|uniref:hypothetical protein n=1 Tax=Aeromonas caviae TaxID=648 RepID=UPI0024C75408|nr:hypothetical protein NRL03_12540 [Aeromonas caviae]WAF62688.1 hypothetical protein NRL19_12620 [Aeromonas caviae]WAF79527.1 hypothetical protein NRL09_12545 [Aeromonas caviae]